MLSRISHAGTGAFGPVRVNCVYWLIRNTNAVATNLVIELDGARMTLAAGTALSGQQGEPLAQLRIISGDTWEFNGIPLGA